VKKGIIIALLNLILFCCVGIINADSTAIGMGFAVDEEQYGIKECYAFQGAYTYVVKNGVNYPIGYSKIKSAAYQDLTDDDWALVILQSTAEPLDTDIPTGIFNIMRPYNSSTVYQDIYSNIDGSSKTFYPGAYIISTNYLMEQPSPRDEPDTVEYTASIEVGEEVKASGSVVFEDNELYLEFYHSSSSNIFHAKFVYSPNFFDVSYMNALTYNKGTFLVDMSTPNSSNCGVFVNTTSLNTRFMANYGGIYGTTYIITTLNTVTVYY